MSYTHNHEIFEVGRMRSINEQRELLAALQNIIGAFAESDLESEIKITWKVLSESLEFSNGSTRLISHTNGSLCVASTEVGNLYIVYIL